MHAGAVRSSKFPRDLTNFFSRNAHYGGNRFCVVACHEGSQFFGIACVRGYPGLVDQIFRKQRMNQGGEKIDVGVGFDLHDVPGVLRGRFDAPGIDVHHFATPRHNVAQRAHGIGHVHEAHVRDLGVGTEAQEVPGVCKVGDRMQIGGAEDCLGGSKFVGTVLGARAERVAHAGGSQEPTGSVAAGGVERRWIAYV